VAPYQVYGKVAIDLDTKYSCKVFHREIVVRTGAVDELVPEIWFRDQRDSNLGPPVAWGRAFAVAALKAVAEQT
jgi:hypothetical protein